MTSTNLVNIPLSSIFCNTILTFAFCLICIKYLSCAIKIWHNLYILSRCALSISLHKIINPCLSFSSLSILVNNSLWISHAYHSLSSVLSLGIYFITRKLPRLWHASDTIEGFISLKMRSISLLDPMESRLVKKSFV